MYIYTTRVVPRSSEKHSRSAQFGDDSVELYSVPPHKSSYSTYCTGCRGYVMYLPTYIQGGIILDLAMIGPSGNLRLVRACCRTNTSATVFCPVSHHLRHSLTTNNPYKNQRHPHRTHAILHIVIIAAIFAIDCPRQFPLAPPPTVFA